MAGNQNNDPKRNPDWERFKGWPFEEDWNSPAWKERMKRCWEKVHYRADLYGFTWCPECKVGHTVKTVTCRGCGYCSISKIGEPHD